MNSAKRKAPSKTSVKFRDLKSKRNPKGGIGSATGGAGAGKIKFESLKYV